MHKDNATLYPMSKGTPLATLEIVAPPGNADKTIIATLKSNGQIVAQGQSQITRFDDARIILVNSEHAIHRCSSD